MTVWLQLQAPTADWNRTASIWLQGREALPLTLLGLVTEWLFLGQVVVFAAVVGTAFAMWKRRWRLAASIAAVLPVVLAEVAGKYLLRVPSANHYLATRVLIYTENNVPDALKTGFPSGHAARATFVIGWIAVALLAAKLRVRTAFLVGVLILAVCWTRIYVGDHSLLEIVAGILLALVFLLPAATLVRLDRTARLPAQ
ncbi:MAG: phosphatase PAP2 family protein [Chloroflexi bacterium]|nr:phosphatase PAP2 family protein [Chloroflexota bacterium]